MLSQKVLVDLLRESINESEQELHSLRNSLRYKIGDVMLQALPLSYRSLTIIPLLFKLYKNQSGNLGAKSRAFKASEVSTHSTNQIFELGLGTGFNIKPSLWTTTDPELMALRLRSHEQLDSIILRTLSSSVVRQLARHKYAGTKIVWWPEPLVEHSSELVSYVISLADECCLEDVS